MKFYWNTGGEIQLQFGPKVLLQGGLYRHWPTFAREKYKYNFSYSRNTRRFYWTVI